MITRTVTFTRISFQDLRKTDDGYQLGEVESLSLPVRNASENKMVKMLIDAGCHYPKIISSELVTKKYQMSIKDFILQAQEVK